MTQFTQHTIESAPKNSKPILESANKALGFVPNLYANLAESPTALETYIQLGDQFGKGSLDVTEQQVVSLAASVINECHFCVAAHSLIAKNMMNVDADIVNAIRDGVSINDTKLEALASFTRAVVSERGHVRGQQLDDFLAAGFSREQALDVILGVTMKTLSNYANHLTDTQLNEQFDGEKWSPKA